MGSVVRGVHVGTDLVAGECLLYFTDSRDQNVEFCDPCNACCKPDTISDSAGKILACIAW